MEPLYPAKIQQYLDLPQWQLKALKPLRSAAGAQLLQLLNEGFNRRCCFQHLPLCCYLVQISAGVQQDAGRALRLAQGARLSMPMYSWI